VPLNIGVRLAARFDTLAIISVGFAIVRPDGTAGSVTTGVGVTDVLGGAVVGGVVTGGASGVLVVVTVKVIVEVSTPSLTLTVIVVEPVTSRVVTVTSRFSPVPVTTIPEIGTTLVSDEVTVTTRSPTGCWPSVIVTGTTMTGVVSGDVRSIVEVIDGGSLEFTIVTTVDVPPTMVAPFGVIRFTVKVSSPSCAASMTIGITKVRVPVSPSPQVTVTDDGIVKSSPATAVPLTRSMVTDAGPSLPPVRVTVIVTEPSASVVTMVGKPTEIVPGVLVTVTSKTVVVVMLPSDTDTVIVVVPAPPVVGVTAIVRLAPDPPMMIPVSATTDWSDEVAVTVSVEAGLSGSATVNGIVDVEWC
jgi:hypothetical protein